MPSSKKRPKIDFIAHKILCISDLYPDQNLLPEDYLQNIPKRKLIEYAFKFIEDFERFNNHEHVFDFVDRYFSFNSDEHIRSLLKNVIIEKARETKRNIVILYPLSNFKFFETVLKLIELQNRQENVTYEDPHVNILSCYLAINEIFVTKEESCYEQLEHLPRENALIAKSFMGSLMESDITKFYGANHYLIQFIKCKQLFSYLLFDTKTRKLLKQYLENQNIKNIADYLGKTTVLFELWGHSNGVHVDPINYPKTHAFIENFTITEISDDLHDDFLHIRNKPIIKLEENVYRAIHVKFINDKLYLGLIFDLKKFDKENEIGIPNLSSLLGENFFEDICNLFLNKSFKNNSVRISGKEIKDNRLKNKLKIDGEPDYYIRNHNDIFLFEAKNNLIKNEVKYSFNYSKIEAYLKERFLENNKGSKKIILQLIENYKFILNKKCDFDNPEVDKLRNVYFITILPEETYSSYGMNCIANEWFSNELSSVKEDQHKIKTKPLVIITIDTLIYCIYYIQMGKIKLKEILDIYIKNHIESQSAKQRSVSFTMFINNYIHELKLPPMDFKYSKIISENGFDEIL